jgi:hypothetical protein
VEINRDDLMELEKFPKLLKILTSCGVIRSFEEMNEILETMAGNECVFKKTDLKYGECPINSPG